MTKVEGYWEQSEHRDPPPDLFATDSAAKCHLLSHHRFPSAPPSPNHPTHSAQGILWWCLGALRPGLSARKLFHFPLMPPYPLLNATAVLTSLAPTDTCQNKLTPCAETLHRSMFAGV